MYFPGWNFAQTYETSPTPSVTCTSILRKCRPKKAASTPPKCLKRIFVAIDRTSKVAFAELPPRARRVVAA